MAPWTGEPGHGRHRDGGGRREDGPPARGAVRLARVVRHRGGREPRGGRTRSTRAARTSPRSRGSPASVADAHAAGRLRATTDGAAAARASDVVVLIVPVMLDDEHRPDYRHMDAAAGSIAPGLRAGTTVIFETTLPVGDTRNRYVPLLEAASGLVAERDLFVAFSPERLFTGAVFRNLATYPKLVGGIGPASTDRAARFYASVLDAEVVAMSSAEAAELSKLADTTYRDVNIAFANELARVRGPDRGRRPGGHPGGEQPALQPHPPAGPGRGRALHPRLPALPPLAGPGDGAGRDGAAGQRRPGRRRRRRRSGRRSGRSGTCRSSCSA